MNTIPRLPSPPVSRHSHGLWSLWEMIEKHGLLFAKAIVALSDAKLMCLPMHSGGQPFVAPIEGIIRVASHGSIAMRQACILSDMDDVLPELNRFDSLLNPPHISLRPAPQQISQAILHLLSRVQDNLDQQFFFHVSQQDVRFYGQKMPFGEAVAKRFKDAAEDIERAGTCLAVQQPTACVFHLMRAMELAVRDLARRLKLDITPKSTWRKMTGDMDPKIKAMPDATDRQKRKKNDWEAARANLHHVGSVWRNNTMHPAMSYTQSQALDVLNAVRVFMACLAAL